MAAPAPFSSQSRVATFHARKASTLPCLTGRCLRSPLGGKNSFPHFQGADSEATPANSALCRVVAAGAIMAGRVRHRRRRRTALAESFSGSFQKAWIARVPDEWKPDALRGNWAPVHEEVSGLAVEVVFGELPADFPAGHFLRNGPNPRWVRPLAGYHPFEGDGMLHAVEIRPPTDEKNTCDAYYTNRWVKTAKWLAEDIAQMPLASGMVDENFTRAAANALLNMVSVAVAAPAVYADERMHAATQSIGTANTSVIVHAGKCLALQERSNPVVVSLPNLETLGALHVDHKFTAHPKLCPVTGELIWFSYHDDGIDLGVWDKDGIPVHETTVHLPHSIMAHDIAVTEHYNVVVDAPLRFQPKDVLRGKGPVSFKKDEPMRFGVLPRHGNGKDVEWYTVPGKGKACFHVMNAYEEPSGEIVIIGCSMPDVTLMDMNVKFATQERLTEWRLDPKMRHVEERIISDVPCDFPKINGNFAGKPFRFGYAAAFDLCSNHGGVPMFRGVLKHDIVSGESLVWEAGDGIFVGEPTFVPRAGAQPDVEDDGYLLAHTFNENSQCSEVVVLDARRFGQAPICRLRLPRRVPYGFHATWVPDLNCKV
eukprot:TRINITY_DN90702_c0_g1_i1.p1 TRINITY_DN90702_c0_g1~~TRINITY_DN90702_c0_g1_i1.p1  ORF type:complete len:609 (-),score=100.18 TRINITY_DN90702_c0_g1_i1:507-2294(-)